MAERPWVKPEEVKAYSEYAQVQQRTDERVAVDIMRAEQYVISYTNNNFDDYETIPEAVRTAVMLLAEAYAYKASSPIDGNGKPTGGRKLKGETFDDYSWTGSDEDGIKFEDLDVKLLLDPYVIVAPRNGVTLRMRKL